MWAESGWYEKRVPEVGFPNSIRQVIELRRALDYLLIQPKVDKNRVAVVGEFLMLHRRAIPAQETIISALKKSLILEFRSTNDVGVMAV